VHALLRGDLGIPHIPQGRIGLLLGRSRMGISSNVIELALVVSSS